MGELSKALKIARLDAGLTQAELGEALGLECGQAVSNWERSLSQVPLKRFKQVAQVCGVPVKRLKEAYMADFEIWMNREIKG